MYLNRAGIALGDANSVLLHFAEFLSILVTEVVSYLVVVVLTHDANYLNS